ncbi:hypothetical protein K438DRAFT_1939792 [Mycena galopus ATCC 62051]|nr:hypothetical protein K438DRAFT_1939792 [Mycena galopus ATCC 62051]
MKHTYVANEGKPGPVRRQAVFASGLLGRFLKWPKFYNGFIAYTRLLDVPHYVKPSRDMPIAPESMQPLYQTTRRYKLTIGNFQLENAKCSIKLGYGGAGIIGPGKKQQRNAKAKGTRKAKHIHSQEDASLLDECAVSAGKIVLQSAWLDDLSFSTIFDIQHNLKTGSEILAMTEYRVVRPTALTIGIFMQA